MKRMTILIATVVAMTLGTTVQAATVNLGATTVERTMITQGGSFGGCMVHLSMNVNNKASNCPSSGWVSMSCTGDFMDSERAWRMIDSAQMAKALGMQVNVWVNDHQKHNGYCVVRRIDVIK